MAKYKETLKSDINYLIDLYNTETIRRNINNSTSSISIDSMNIDDWNTYVAKIESLFTNTSRYTGCSIVTSSTTYSCSTDTYKKIAANAKKSQYDYITEQSRFNTIAPVSYLNGFEACSPYQRTTYTTTTCSCECNNYCSCDCDDCSCECEYCWCDCNDACSCDPECDCDSDPGCKCVGDCVCVSLTCDCQGAGASIG